MPIFNRLSTTLCMTTEQNKLLLSYPAHIVNYAEQVMLNNTRLMKWGTKDKQARYLLTTCSNQASKKYRSYDPISVATKTTVAVKPSPSKETTGPVVNPEIPTSVSTPPLSLQPQPTTTTDVKANSASVEDIIRYVADNFGIESMEVTENGRTTKSVLSDKGIVSKGSVLPKHRSPADVRKVATYDSEGRAHVTTKEESGLAAMAMFAQDMIKSAPVAEKTIVDESIHQPKHATVEDLIVEATKPLPIKIMATSDDDCWLNSLVGDMEEWESIP